MIPRSKVDEMKIEYQNTYGNIDLVKQESIGQGQGQSQVQSQGPAAHQGNEYEHQEHH